VLARVCDAWSVLAVRDVTDAVPHGGARAKSTLLLDWSGMSAVLDVVALPV